jgi:AmmeMemoRadiSam system protein B
MIKDIRYPAVAGMFYPSSSKELEKVIGEFLEKVEKRHLPGEVKGLIVPHAGYVYSGPVAASGFKLLEGGGKKIIILGPSHFMPLQGASFSDADYWQTPLGKVSVDKPKEEEPLVNVPQAHLQEHSLEVQLPFLQSVLKDFSIMPIVTGEVAPSELYKALERYIDSETIVIASSDLSHYNSYERAKEIDSESNEAISSMETIRMQGIDACGKTPILTLAHIASSFGWKPMLLDYRNSGDTAGDKEHVVGYSAYAFYK